MTRLLDRCAQVGMIGGIACLLQPWWDDGFRYGFFLTVVFTLVHIVTSHIVLSAREVKEG